MGVPAFFRWLSRKYPNVVVNANEDRQKDVNGEKIPIDATQPNPNFQEFDNLYLDMNGIIHPCTHPEDRPAPSTEDEMFVLIFEYIDRIFSIVRPRKLLYMAIDGVAPRAKMNQQRSRRFRASKEAAEKTDAIAEQRKRLQLEGISLPPEKKDKVHFDSNCITPGTPFMARLATALRYYIHDRLTNNPAWAKIQVILSDANAPGEGEHKIMDFIRKQRAAPAHNPDTVHCLCGADADLIMLGLATHETNFNIIREEFIPSQPRPCELCGQYGHELKECRGMENEEAGPEQADPIGKEKNFIFLRIPVLREYLERELAMPNAPFPFELERAIDDWVFLCFFVGNDFLPHLPSLEIREGAIDRLVKLYKDMVYTMKGYLTKDGIPHMERVEKIMMGLGQVEDEIFKRRQQEEERREANYRAKRGRFDSGPANRGYSSRGRAQRPAYVPGQGSLIAPLSQAQPLSGRETRLLAADARKEAMVYSENEEAARRLKALMKGGGSTGEQADSSTTTNSQSSGGKGKKRKADAPLILDEAANEPVDEEEDDVVHDEVRLYEAGWKERYYRAKFDVDGNDVEFRRQVALAYAEGLCWVLHYYYQGCASWDWYFPYHYAPFASDFDSIGTYKPDFSRPTTPFKPLEQLMSVFPAASKSHLPTEWQKLMTDDLSPIIDFYPIDFKVDLNGKKFAWQGVALLPFVDENRLLKALKKVYPTLTDEETQRNTTGPNRLFIGKHHPAFLFLQELYANRGGPPSCSLDPKFTYGVSGEVSIDEMAVEFQEAYVSPIKDDNCPDLQVNLAISVIYADPSYPTGFLFPAIRLPNAKELPRTLRPDNYNERRDGPYRPQIGFQRHTPRASLDASGHRQLHHEIRGAQAHNQNEYRGRFDAGAGYEAHSYQQQFFQVQEQTYGAATTRGGYNDWGRGAPAYGGSYAQPQNFGQRGGGAFQSPYQQQSHMQRGNGRGNDYQRGRGNGYYNNSRYSY